ncbi:hypothetical protein CDD82_5659 [Ophiocordyceps australis]|uniref:DNA-directed RNA polymerase subunit beta n=1 Tax=Ophiocordyceps australis TaxID=1399860 RepID=A0A2C5Y4T4_9HYPO|nr:hypothetical protein CDD82_5659 [Ophiocordyceps australis]
MKNKPPATEASRATDTEWDHQYNTLRREKLFRHPPVDRTAYPALQEAVDAHIKSFNAVFGTDEKPGLLDQGIMDIGVKTYLDGDETTPLNERNQLHMRIKSVVLQKPMLPLSNPTTGPRYIEPAECRMRHSTYRGRLQTTLEYWSNRCWLEKKSPSELVDAREESEELGGYFVVNGIEKIVRMLVLNRRNFPMAIVRQSFANRAADYTQYGVLIRCVRPDETSQTNVLHYLKDGNVTFRFSWRKAEYVVPVMMILKALIDANDRQILEGLVGPKGSRSTRNTHLMDRVEIMLRTYKAYNLHTRHDTRAYLGSKFRRILGIPACVGDDGVGTEFLRRIVLVHLGNVNVKETQNEDKFNLLLFMIRKLYALAAGECATDNPDAIQNQEVLLGGFLYGQIIKERLEEFLHETVRTTLREWIHRQPKITFTWDRFHTLFAGVMAKNARVDIGSALAYFLSTGNLSSPSGLDLSQTSGFSVVAEKLNFLRFISHFRAVHRGAFFAQLKTTTVRKLLPESWGFLCPVHTPDGAPCGLLNHLAHKCEVMTEALNVSALSSLAADWGLSKESTAATDENVVVMLDGRILGWCSPAMSRHIADCLRHWKVEGTNGVPLKLEIGYVPASSGGSYPGIYMSSKPARMVRPVKYLQTQKEDFVGPLEQPYMSIAVVASEAEAGETTHVELDPTNMLSILANMTPFSDFNQSPRNMYQCQMGKQTMGTPGTAMSYRADNKTYRLQTGQTPLVRAPLHNTYGFDNFPNGTNAVVAVLSYTAYDMDDAMIINQSAHQRGFGYGTIYKTKKIALADDKTRMQGEKVVRMIGFAPHGFGDEAERGVLDPDGLPRVGQRIAKGDALCAWHVVVHDRQGALVNVDRRTHYERYQDDEAGYIDQVHLLGAESGAEPLQTVCIKVRVPREPFIGDKFSSRHGQKGVLSKLWPACDLPFSESGMQPDVIINPHAFPSRMTIGMFVESMAGKAGALHGLAQDSTPFRFDEEHNTAADYFGQQLVRAGFNYHGNEPMYSGTTGQELGADIYIGLVYYQRLRHMVNDKYQARTKGPVVRLTGQPVGGRSRSGGIRVGEMERDALLGHGTAFLLQDRLLNCSDYSQAWLCRVCGSFLSTQPTVTPFAPRKRNVATIVRCRNCAVLVADDADIMHLQGEMWEDGLGNRWVGGEQTTQVAIPFVLKYLDVELAAMGIKLKYKVGRGGVVYRTALRAIEPPKPVVAC